MNTKIITLSLLITIFTACHKNTTDFSGIDFRAEMRKFVEEISQYARQQNPDFIIIPQNGQAIITDDGTANGSLQTAYAKAIDGCGREDLFYGYQNDDQPTPQNDKESMLQLCKLFKQNNLQVLVTDYCYTHAKIDDSYTQNQQNGFISFAAPERSLNVIPSYPAKPFNENTEDINHLNEAKNFLYLINGDKFSSKQDFIRAVAATNYDLIIMDAFFNGEAFTSNEIATLKQKQNGAKRLVVAYMSIGEAENYRFYWNNDWNKNKPDWLEEENPDWEGNYKVQYWNTQWKSIIYGNNNAYLDKILSAGFQGVYLDIIDAYEYFEQKTQ